MTGHTLAAQTRNLNPTDFFFGGYPKNIVYAVGPASSDVTKNYSSLQ